MRCYAMHYSVSLHYLVTKWAVRGRRRRRRPALHRRTPRAQSMSANDTDNGERDNTAADSTTVESTGIADVRASMLNYNGEQSPTEIEVHDLTAEHIPLDVHWNGPHGEVGILAQLHVDEAETLAEQLEKSAAALREASRDV